MYHKLKILITNDSGNKFLPIFKSMKYDNVLVFDFDIEKNENLELVKKLETLWNPIKI